RRSREQCGRGPHPRPSPQAGRRLHPQRARRRLSGAAVMRASALRSLRTRLLVWLLGGVALVGVAGGLVVYRNALAEADAFFDYHLKETALFLRDQPVEYQFPTPLPPNDVAYDFVVQIWTIDGRRIYIGPEQAVLPPNSTAIGYSTVNTSGGQWRVYGAVSPTKVVQVAQPM